MIVVIKFVDRDIEFLYICIHIYIYVYGEQNIVLVLVPRDHSDK